MVGAGEYAVGEGGWEKMVKLCGRMEMWYSGNVVRAAVILTVLLFIYSNVGYDN